VISQLPAIFVLAAPPGGWHPRMLVELAQVLGWIARAQVVPAVLAGVVIGIAAWMACLIAEPGSAVRSCCRGPGGGPVFQYRRCTAGPRLRDLKAGNRIALIPPVSFGKTAGAPGFRIDENARAREIVGFRASFLESGAICLNRLDAAGSSHAPTRSSNGTPGSKRRNCCRAPEVGRRDRRLAKVWRHQRR
jgi:hypothetical protein